MSALIFRFPKEAARRPPGRRRRLPLILAAVVAVPALAALGHALNGDAVTQVELRPPASTLEDFRSFRNLCEAEAQATLNRPETFRADHFSAAFPIREGSLWRWSLPFSGANAFGMVGHYTATCAGDGQVRVSLER